MKIEKILDLSIIAMTALYFTGCGGSNNNGLNDNNDSQNNVIVERGATYDANVTDANGQTGVQINGQNVYAFATAPKYPVTVKGGWIDVNGDGQLDTNDTLLTSTMSSYSNIVTPVTTYIADNNQASREDKLRTLAALTGVDEAELLKVASQADTKAILTINALYQEMVDQNTTNVNLDDVRTTLNNLQNNVDLTGITDSKEIARKVEAKTMENLLTKGKISALNMSDLDEIQKFNVFGITWKNRKKDDYAQRSYKGNSVKVVNDEIIMTARRRTGNWSSRAELRAQLKTPVTRYTAKVILASMSNDYGKAEINAYFTSLTSGNSWKQLQTSISIKNNKIWYGVFKETQTQPYIEIAGRSERQTTNTFKNVTLSCTVSINGDTVTFNVKDMTNNHDYPEQIFDLSGEPLWNEMDNSQKHFEQLIVRSVFDDRHPDANKKDYSDTVMKLIDLDTK